MRIVETREDFDAFLRVVQTHPPILVPVFTDATLHPAAGNDLCLLGAVTPDETYGLPFAHSEAQNLPPEWLTALTAPCFTSCAPDLWTALPHLTAPVGDLQALEYVATGSVTAGETFVPSVLRQLSAKFAGHRHVYRALPLVKWMEYVQAYGAHLSGVLQAQRRVVREDPGYFFLATHGLPVLHALERSGLHVDRTLLHDRFPHVTVTPDDLVYSRYNLYSATGRPSCTWGGLNFAALNKHDGTRKAFTSRFPKGQMVLLDFESYHLRLIADLIGETLPEGVPAHEYFGRQYFHTTNALTPEQYDESKRRSFFALYSDAEGELPFFRAVTSYRKKLWAQLSTTGRYDVPHRTLWLDRMTDPGPAKAFNYVLQWIETERNLILIGKALEAFASAQSKIVLYTYDAILIDYCLDDGRELLTNTIDILEEGGRFPMRVFYGDSYGELKNVPRNHTQKLVLEK